MKKLYLQLPLFLLFLFAVSQLYAQPCCDTDGDADLCYLSGADYCGSNAGSCYEYSLDGNWMINALTAKLNSPNNFGPNGTVECDLELKKLEPANVASVQAINDCGCDIIFLPNVFIQPGTNIQNLDTSFIPVPILQTIYDWSIECDNNLVIATQAEAEIWGYTMENANVNPNTPVAGTSLFTIYDGPFGSLDFFNQGGAYQGVFTSTPATGHEVLAHDANNNTTAALDLATNDIVVGDIGIFCSGGAGVVSPGPNIVNNNDILICNLFALACALAEEASSSLAVYEICPGETVTLPDGSIVADPGTYIDTLIASGGCDSIVTTAVAYGISQATLFPDKDTSLCKGDTIALDGSLPYDLPAPVFTNTTDYVISPPGTNIISSVDVSGFGSEVMGPDIIESVCFDITHPWLDDLDILLVAPNGEFLELTSDNGLNGSNYTGTCFTPTATTIITDAPGPPYTGEWLPEGDWSILYGSSINGSWQLVVRDDAPGFTGTLQNWTITFKPGLEVFYDWETDAGLSCPDCPVTEAYPLETTTYYLTLSDSYGCQIIDSINLEVENILPAPNAVCDSANLNNIFVSWDSLAGAQGYEVNISGTGWIAPNNSDFAHIIAGLVPLDTLSIAVRGLDDCRGEITQLVCSTPDCNKPTPSIDMIQSASCFGADDGSFTLSASGGAGGYTFELDGLVNSNGDFANLEGGIYEVLITDTVSCSISLEVEVPEPPAIVLTPVVESPISCNGTPDGSLTYTIENGMAPFSVDWDGLSSDSIFTGLSAGNYALTVTDDNGCTGSADILMSEPFPLEASLESDSTSCFGENNGSAILIPNGGTSPYTYLWDTGSGSQTDSIATGLSAGTYSVTLTDANDCEWVSEVAVQQPSELSADLSADAPDCHDAADGSITVTPSGGTAGYSYNWSEAFLPNIPNITNLPAGSYSVTVSDQNGCSTTLSTTLDNPAPIELELQPADALCFNGNEGSITSSVSGAIGTPVYNWDNGDNIADISELTSATYCLTVTDDNGCTAEACAFVDQPPALVLSASTEDAGCEGQSNGLVDLTVDGGTNPYQYSWSNNVNTEDVSGLLAGNYSVTVLDANGCEETLSVIIEENSPFELGFIALPPACFGESSGAIDLAVNGAAGQLSYTWSGTGGYQYSQEDPENISAGNYAVTVTDEEGCTAEGEVNVTEPTPIAANTVVKEISCFGKADGRILLSASGGSSPYLYSFNAGGNFQPEAYSGNLDVGSYEWTVQDANGCEFSGTTLIPEPDEIVLQIEPELWIFLGQSYGYNAVINIPPGQIDSISWTPVSGLSCTNCLNPIAQPEVTTPYVVEVVDTNGCILRAQTVLRVNSEVDIYVPNAFSPNGDGVNEVLAVYSNNPVIRQINSFQLFDRWGEQLFRADDFLPNDEESGWDGRFKGKKVQAGVFSWMVEVQLVDGETMVFRGDVTVVD
jgi:gliding motility-associated-like protein